MREEEMEGIKKESFRLFYGGGELWIEHLDGIHEATDAAILKLRADYARLKRPSMPGAVAVNLEGTRVNAPLITEIARLFMSGEKSITRVAFPGVNNLFTLIRYHRKKGTKAVIPWREYWW